MPIATYDRFVVGKVTAQMIPADAEAQKKITNAGGGTLYYKNASDVDSGDSSLAAGASVTVSENNWIIGSAEINVLVETKAASTSQDSTVTDDLSVGDDATVEGDLAVTGVSTLTAGVAGGSPLNVRTWQPVTATSGTDTACSNGTAYVGSVFLPRNATIRGISYLVGSVGGTDKVVASLHNSAGRLLAYSARAGATVGTARQVQAVDFTATYDAVGPGNYFVALTFNGTTAKFQSVPAHCQAGVIGDGVTQTFGTPADFTAPTAFVADKTPVAFLHA